MADEVEEKEECEPCNIFKNIFCPLIGGEDCKKYIEQLDNGEINIEDLQDILEEKYGKERVTDVLKKTGEIYGVRQKENEGTERESVGE